MCYSDNDTYLTFAFLGSPRASIDKEIAASLLDLSKGREKEAAARAAEAEKNDPSKGMILPMSLATNKGNNVYLCRFNK